MTQHSEILGYDSSGREGIVLEQAGARLFLAGLIVYAITGILHIGMLFFLKTLQAWAVIGSIISTIQLVGLYLLTARLNGTSPGTNIRLALRFLFTMVFIIEAFLSVLLWQAGDPNSHSGMPERFKLYGKLQPMMVVVGSVAMFLQYLYLSRVASSLHFRSLGSFALIIGTAIIIDELAFDYLFSYGLMSQLPDRIGIAVNSIILTRTIGFAMVQLTVTIWCLTFWYKLSNRILELRP